jgi:NADP-dependent 3-hydroxy acid dehydrogenase YdfG
MGPPIDWKDRVVAVTGASSGIGAALAREIGRRGGSIVIAARRADKLAEVAGSIAAPCVTVVADVTRRNDVARILEVGKARFGKVDAWVNNAGRGISRAVEDLTDDDVDEMIRMNVKSALYGMQTVLPHFKERRHGHLVNVSSMLARVPFATFRSAYSAAKHALNSLTENVRMDLSRDHPEIVVTCVMPGVVLTDFGINALGGGADSRSLPGGQTAEQVAAIIADTLERGRGGDVYTALGALERVLQYISALAAERTAT